MDIGTQWRRPNVASSHQWQIGCFLVQAFRRAPTPESGSGCRVRAHLPCLHAQNWLEDPKNMIYVISCCAKSGYNDAIVAHPVTCPAQAFSLVAGAIPHPEGPENDCTQAQIKRHTAQSGLLDLRFFVWLLLLSLYQASRHWSVS
jgi:hypothetical protein